jgi:glycerate kinase
MPRLVVASDKFKGSLTSVEVAAADAVGFGVRRISPDARVDVVPVADGGDGTLAAAVAAGFELIPATVSGPTGEAVRSGFARRGETAVVELADASGLIRLSGGVPAPMTATSRGTGELIATAIDHGCTRIILGIGGSASTDGGAGLVCALGAKLYDANGAELPEGGAVLSTLASVDLTALTDRLTGIEVIVACDVDNPLTGPTGAAAVYGPQKGADPAQVKQLDAALTHWADLVARTHRSNAEDLRTGGSRGPRHRARLQPVASSAPHPTTSCPSVPQPATDLRHTPDPDAAGADRDASGAGVAGADLRDSRGAGAAGGVGFAALSLLGAELRPGIDLMLDLVGFHEQLVGADLVITGEGALDEQTLHGKGCLSSRSVASIGSTRGVSSRLVLWRRTR